MATGELILVMRPDLLLDGPMPVSFSRYYASMLGREGLASGSAALGKDGKGALDNVAEAFKDLKGKNVVVGGYTDDVPTNPKSFPSNWELSTARAIAVVKYLQSKGVDPVMLAAAGFSEFRPVASNETPEGRRLNRRIEIALTAADYVPPAVDAPAR